MVGFSMAIWTMRTAVRYIALFLMAQSYAGFIVFLAWASNSIPSPSSKRAVALAFINAFAQLGNIAGSYAWLKSWGPTYRYSYSICIATSALSIVMCFAFRRHLAALNRERERVDGELPKSFRYML
jgi:hypothetical protein